MFPEKPYWSFTQIVEVPDAPGETVRDAGDPLSEKPGGAAAMPISMSVLADTTPEVPVIVIVAFPIAAVLLAVSVSKLVPLVGFVENETVTPLGRPEALSMTLPAKPGCGSTVIVDVRV